MLITICTIRQLPQALALGESFAKYASDSKTHPVVIGLADDPTHLPAGFKSPYPLWPASEVLAPEQLGKLSAQYTPTEFAAACKPAFIEEAFRRFPDEEMVLYADPNVLFFSALTPVWNRLNSANVLLTPHITRSPADSAKVEQDWPDEKFFQNIGLYSADFLAFRRSDETDRLLAWWRDRVEERAYIDFCTGLCTDQIWLMHVPVFFPHVVIVKDAAWHVALWNLPQRHVKQEADSWRVSDSDEPLLFINAKGLYNPDEGFFANQNRLKLADRPDASLLVAAYKKAVSSNLNSVLTAIGPAYGQQPEPVVLRGWRRATVDTMRAITQFVDNVPLPVLR
ncbi:hypothetical protein [Spirosoma endbachense]|uniref:Glycosyl transferase n=1 Tax=Spirosoma endbachense TaxID=2666025 RepID=A0A6P1W484_9BACT|nr:hypothetical protein [Spirosoma endbachense]QHV99825.1 hypothetical protein GJR95_34570 [Spirosoma endbachense]